MAPSSSSGTGPDSSRQGVGHRQSVDEGLGGEVYLTGRPLAIDDYDAYVRRAGIVPPRMLGAVVGVPLSSGDQVVGRHRPRIGLGRPDVPRPRDRCADAVRAARLDRPRQRAAGRRRAARRPLRPDHRAAQSRAPDRPDRPLARAGPHRRGRADRGHPARPRPVQGDQRERGPRRRRSAAGRRRPAAGRVASGRATPSGGSAATSSGSSSTRWRTRTRPNASRTTSRPNSARRSRSAAASGSSAPRWGSPSATPIALSPDELLREAEIAMVRAKGDPTIRHALFEPSMSTQTLERIDLENDLRRALQRHELRAHYQPIVDLTTARVMGFEALVRWQHPTRGLDPTALVHPPRRGDRPDRTARSMGPRDRVPTGGGLARCATARGRARDVGQPLGPAVRPAGARRRDRRGPRREPASTRVPSSSRSPSPS